MTSPYETFITPLISTPLGLSTTTRFPSSVLISCRRPSTHAPSAFAFPPHRMTFPLRNATMSPSFTHFETSNEYLLLSFRRKPPDENEPSHAPTTVVARILKPYRGSAFAWLRVHPLVLLLLQAVDAVPGRPRLPPWSPVGE